MTCGEKDKGRCSSDNVEVGKPKLRCRDVIRKDIKREKHNIGERGERKLEALTPNRENAGKEE